MTDTKLISYEVKVYDAFEALVGNRQEMFTVDFIDYLTRTFPISFEEAKEVLAHLLEEKKLVLTPVHTLRR